MPKIPGGRCLDLGCGQGHTTRFLAGVLQPGECVGVDYDGNLVDHATAQPDNPAGVRFQQGDASKLDFPDASFDVVFARYLLVHLADPMVVIREMLRVVRPGGHLVAFEPDCGVAEFSYPASVATAYTHKLWNGLFATPEMGRKLVHCFRSAGASILTAGALLRMEHNDTLVKRVYRLTFESIGAGAIAKGLFSEDEYRTALAELQRMELDPLWAIVKFPDMGVVATR